MTAAEIAAHNAGLLASFARQLVDRSGEPIRGPEGQFHHQVPAPYVGALRAILDAMAKGRPA